MPRGYSLLELLVTIAVIAVLIGVLLPALPLARDAARRSACGSNLRQIGVAIELYKGDSNEVLPRARYMPRPWLSGDDAAPLNEALGAYLDSGSGVWRCPGDTVVHATTYDDGRRTTGVSYTYVSELGGQPYERTFFFSKFGLSASETPLAHDFDGGTFETQDGDFVFVDFFHSRRNMLFVDGHVGRFE